MHRHAEDKSSAAPAFGHESPIGRTFTPARVRGGASLRHRLRTQGGRILQLVDTDLLVRSAARPLRQPFPRVPLEIQELTMATGAMEAIPKKRWPRIQFYLHRGDTGYIGTVDGKYVGEVWLSRVTHRGPWSGLLIQLAPDEAYAHSLWVTGEYRAQGVPVALMVRMLQAVADDPALTRVYGWVDRRNRESQTLLRLLGFTDVQRVKRLHVLRWGRQVPRSDKPAWGPLSTRGRHSGDERGPDTVPGIQ
jgi:RimJ/RimL family protein N-acetyltransferase